MLFATYVALVPFVEWKLFKIKKKKDTFAIVFNRIIIYYSDTNFDIIL